MLKVVVPTTEQLSTGSKIHNNIIVERTSKAGKQIFGIMFQDKQLSPAAGFIGGTKTAFMAASSLEDMKESMETYNLKPNTPVKGFRIVYDETLNAPENDESYQKVPVIFVDENDKKYTKDGVFLTSEGAEISRKSYIVPINSDIMDTLLIHDKIETTVISKEDLANAAKTMTK